ncbi:MAG: recombinase family protein [Lachnospiraceae bacterium]|nr:recombinase family protein [Lachnospiraceae bacterium]
MEDVRIAIYIRLSNADEDTGHDKDESNSVVNQRSLINSFLDNHKELSGYPRTEFIDDGFTGTNMDRPAFQRMISQIRSGKYNVCITKDFSRFARDYIEMGDYIECIFPFLNVRYISINDNYDSVDYKGTTGGLDVVMRSIVYAAYSRDLSIKSKTGRKQNMKKGRRVGGFPGYGYKLDPNNTSMDIIDPEAAKVVRRIFDEAIEGKSVGMIAKSLNDDNIMPPAEYFRVHNPELKKYKKTYHKKSVWTYYSVYYILKRYTYTGASVGGTIEQKAPLSKQMNYKSMDDWIIVPDMHEAIISVEEYNKAQEVIEKKNRKKREVRDYPLKRLLICGNCGRVMKYNNRIMKYHCVYFQNGGLEDCRKVRTIKEDKLVQIVLGAIKDFIKYANVNVDIRQKKWNKGHSKIVNIQVTKDTLEVMKNRKFKEYEKYVSGKCDKESYLKAKADIDKQISELQMSLKEPMVAVEHDDQEEEYNIAELSSVCRRFAEADELTHDMAKAFVDNIIVYPDNRLEIKWRFNDCFIDNQSQLPNSFYEIKK